MEVTFLEDTVSDGERRATLEFLVASGAAYTVLPWPTWRALALTRMLQPMRMLTA